MARKLSMAITLALFSLFLCYGLGEILVRALNPQREVPRWFISHPRYGYFHRKNFQQLYRYQKSDQTWLARFNEYGLRGPPLGKMKPDERRVLCVGDSFTFGYGLDEGLIFPTLLEKQLNQRSSLRWRVINAGVGGWGLLQQELFVRDHLPLFNPDVLVVTVCDNDANDDLVFSRGRAGGLLPDFPLKRWLRDNSHLYRLLYGMVADRLYARVFEPEGGPARIAQSASYQTAWPKPGETNDAVLEEMFRPRREIWQASLDAILRMRDELIAQNPKGFVVLQMAQPYRVDLHYFLSRLADGHTIYFVDMLPDAWRIGQENWLLPYDPHWTHEVHELSAEYLADLILGQELRWCEK